MKKYFFLFCLLISFVGFGQDLSTPTTYTVHFPSDQHTLTAQEEQQLRAFLIGLKTYNVHALRLSGHTDGDGSNEYNKVLSERRVQMVTEYLSTMIGDTCALYAEYHGEEKPIDDNESFSGKQNNRRVEIAAEISVTQQSVEPPFIEIKREITGDTIIKLPEGTLLELPKKDYLDNPNCITVQEFVSGESVRSAGLTTAAEDGSTLISGGMFDVQMCDESNCATLLVPLRTVCGQEVPFTQWTAEEIRSSWSEKSSRPLPIRMIGEQRFYEMEICGSGAINCDVRTPPKKCRLFEPKTRVKLKNGYRIKRIYIATDDPMTIEKPIRQTSRKAVFFRNCTCTEPLIYVEATNKKGESKTIQYLPLNEFDKREAFSKCKTDEVEKKILWFKISKKTKYRKYLIRKEDFPR